MGSFVGKMWKLVTHVQVLSVFLAFALMVFLSYNYMSSIERSHLIKNVDNVIKNTQSQITADLMEPETTLGIIAENVRNMIVRGMRLDDVIDYLTDTSVYMTKDERLMAYVTRAYGIFDYFDEAFWPGVGITLPNNYVPYEREWYKAAVKADGKIGVTDPYHNLLLNITCITFARRIFDDYGNPLGIVCLDVQLNRIQDYVINSYVSEGSYGILFDRNFDVLAHPNPAYVGRNLVLMNDGQAIKEMLLQGNKISELLVVDYNGNEAVAFLQQMDNGWYIAIIMYAGKYYQSVREIGTILTILGTILASILIFILLSIVAGKKKAEERTRIMLDAVPVCAAFWDKDYNIIDCNQEAAKLFDLSHKNVYLERFYELSPEHQPDGEPSAQKIVRMLKEVFHEGYTRFEWTHQKLTGEQIPTEVTFIRVMYRGESIVCGYTRDLRELNAAMSKLREADERVMLMLDAAPIGVTMWDRDYNLVDFNYEAARVVGIHNKDEYRERFAETAPEYQNDGRKSFDVLKEYIDKTFLEGSNHTIWDHNSVDGETIPFDARSIRLVLRDDPIVIVYSHDLRELNTVISKMRDADEFRQTLFDTTPLGSFMINSSHIVLECNQEIVRLFDLADKNEYLERFFDLFPEYQPDGRLSGEKIVELINNTFIEGINRFEWLHRKLNGELLPCEITLICVIFRNEKMVCGYIRDLREIRTMMTKMREADECTQVIFDASPLGCFMIDNVSNILECNQEVVKLFGLSDKKEYINNLYNYYPEYQPSGEESAEKIQKYINEAFEEGYCRFEMTHQKKDGEQIPTEVTLVRVKYRGVYAVAGYIRDLRELKTMIAEMRRAEVAEESSKAKSDFLAKMSHEIRTPMNAILGITEIQLQNSSLPLITREALERIYNSGDLLLGIINDILDLSKIEAGKFELANVQYDIASLIHDIVKLNMIRYESKPIDFKLDVNENIPAVLIGDELRIKQILNNILSNAYKYTQEGQIRLAVYTEKTDEPSHVVLFFRVSDTGQGMTADQVTKLGDKFSRFNMEANRKTEGTGLGMNITRNLIQLMKGDFFVESTPGLGSTFTVSLPQECSDNSIIGREFAENLMKLNLKSTAKTRNLQIKQDFMPYGRVLVVDDVETNLYVARGLLAPYGLTIETAISGFEAIAKIRNDFDFDVIFMDHMMPRMDGIEATKLIRNLGFKNPVVALTANAISGQEEMFLNNGFDDFISKPIDIRQLNAVLNRLIRDKQPASVLEEAKRQRNVLYAAGGHNIAVNEDLAGFFVRDAEKAVIILDEIYQNNCKRDDDFPIFIINVHAMKSALANIGESVLADEASQLEQAGRDRNEKLILYKLPEFLVSLRQIIEKLKPHEAGEGDEVHSEDIDSLFLQEKLLVIQNACSSMDKKTAKEALADLKDKVWPKAIRDKLSAISEYLLHSEFDEAAEIAKEI